MKLNKLLSTSLIMSSFLLATTIPSDSEDQALLAKMKTNGLVSIPVDKAELLKITDPSATLTDKKIELGKKLYFEPRL
ncbi:MAG: hypothetical protein KJO45_00260, partial [Sulfurovum sp.]|nr:hypothetical protein [Sulfurovum sp.]